MLTLSLLLAGVALADPMPTVTSEPSTPSYELPTMTVRAERPSWASRVRDDVPEPAVAVEVVKVQVELEPEPVALPLPEVERKQR